MFMTDSKFILGIDFGSTHACATLYSHDLKIQETHTEKVERIEGPDGSCELDPDGVWDCFCRVLHGVLQNAGIVPEKVACLGISVQRNSFMLWDRQTGKPRSRVISWQDLRATELTKQWNKSLTLRSLKAGGHLLYGISRSARFKALASYRFRTTLACIRLKHFLDDRPSLLEECRQGRICYGCLETWFLWRLTNGKVFATDISCASVSGMYDPFSRKWSGPIMTCLGIPHQILPDVRPSSHLYGYVEAGPLRVSNNSSRVPITGIIGDAQAATLTEDCLGPGQAKLTLGTGTFLNLSTGHKPRALMSGFYPVVGWASAGEFSDTTSLSELNDTPWRASTSVSTFQRYSFPTTCNSVYSFSSTRSQFHTSDVTFLLEGSHANTGTLITWLQSEGIFSTYAELEDMLAKGDQLEFDYRNPFQTAFYVTVPPELLSRHQETLELYPPTAEQRKLLGPDGVLTGVGYRWSEMDRLLVVRAVMESIALTVRHMLDRCRREAGVSPTELRVNGNVSLSNWLMQRLADVTNIPVQRSEFVDSSCMGAAIAAGVGAGIWPNYPTATGLLHGHRNRNLSGTQNRTDTACFLPRTDRVSLMHTRYQYWSRSRAAYSRKLRRMRLSRAMPSLPASSSSNNNNTSPAHNTLNQVRPIHPLQTA